MKKYAVITGASSGIGKEMAKILAKRGYALILVARREKRLESLARALKTEVIPFEADVSRDEDRKRLLELIDRKNVEIFINNAGFGDCGKFTDTSLEKEKQMIDVNITAVHVFTKEMVKRFVKKDHGYLLNVASSAGLLPAGPFMATYYATKAYVASLTQAVAEELKERGKKVYVGALCPGPVRTEFDQVADVKFSMSGISAKRCASYAINQMFLKELIIVPTFYMKAAVFFSRLLPREVLLPMTAKQQMRKIYK